MSSWAYKDCQCGNSVHINFTCNKCNGDPWNERKKLKDEIDLLKSTKENLLSQIQDIDDNISKNEQMILDSYHVL